MNFNYFYKNEKLPGILYMYFFLIENMNEIEFNAIFREISHINFSYLQILLM